MQREIFPLHLSPKRKAMRKITLAAVIVVMALFMSGAGLLQAQQITVTDALERQINFDASPQRIVVTSL